MTEIFITPWTERKRFETELQKIAPQQLNSFVGHLMSWDSDKKKPIINDIFIDSLSQQQKDRLQDLIESL
jgi:hypothetical protein